MDTQQSLQPGQPWGWNLALLSSCWSHPCHQGCFVHESLSKDRGGRAGCSQTFIVEAVLVTWLLKPLFFVCFVFFLLIHMEHEYLPILFPKTSIYIPSSGLFFHESYNCAHDHSTKPLATFHELVSSWSFGISPYRPKQTGNYPDWSSAFYWKTSPYAQLTGRLNKNRRSWCGAQKDVLRTLQGEEWLMP